jgi:hypothetical protein
MCCSRSLRKTTPQALQQIPLPSLIGASRANQSPTDSRQNNVTNRRRGEYSDSSKIDDVLM